MRKDDSNSNFSISFFKENVNLTFLDIALKESKQEEIVKIQKVKKVVANQKTLKKKGYDDIFFGVYPKRKVKIY